MEMLAVSPSVGTHLKVKPRNQRFVPVHVSLEHRDARRSLSLSLYRVMSLMLLCNLVTPLPPSPQGLVLEKPKQSARDPLPALLGTTSLWLKGSQSFK